MKLYVVVIDAFFFRPNPNPFHFRIVIDLRYGRTNTMRICERRIYRIVVERMCIESILECQFIFAVKMPFIGFWIFLQGLSDCPVPVLLNKKAKNRSWDRKTCHKQWKNLPSSFYVTLSDTFVFVPKWTSPVEIVRCYHVFRFDSMKPENGNLRRVSVKMVESLRNLYRFPNLNNVASNQLKP